MSRNGYRFEITSWKVCNAQAIDRCDVLVIVLVGEQSGVDMCGCSVFTRPPRISGKPVTWSTGVTGTPASAIVLAVDPVETISTPASCNPRARSTMPVLSYTEIRARRTAISGHACTPCAVIDTACRVWRLC